MNIHRRIRISLFSGLMLLSAGMGAISGQFVSRYPLLKGFTQHNYFEGYELPVLGTGPIDPAAAPDGRHLVFSARGWLWRYHLPTGMAVRLTKGGECDFRPAVSPDGRKIAFVRDDTRTMKIMLMDFSGNAERILIESGKIDLDPAFSPDGGSLYYSSSRAGTMDIWRIDLATGRNIRITEDSELEMRPLPLPDGERLLYVAKGGRGRDRLILLEMKTGRRKVLKSGPIISQMHPAVSADGRTVVLNWPAEAHYQSYQLQALDLSDPSHVFHLTYDLRLPLTPCLSADDSTIYFVEADEHQDFILKAIPLVGGEVEILPVTSWDWREPTGRIVIRTRMEGEPGPLPARLSVRDANGHPLFPDRGNARFDSQNGMFYFHSAGEATIIAPAGGVTITAAHGFVAAPVTVTGRIPREDVSTLDATLKRIWDPRRNGWYCGDLHFHLNYGGTYYLTPEHLVPMAKGEDLDLGVPMTANLRTRYMDTEWINWTRDEPPIIHFGQEVRSRFLGHVGLVGIRKWYHPWFYGPTYPIYDRLDRPNSMALQHARMQNGFNIYVHPIYREAPFEEGNLEVTPANLIPDALQGNFDALEIACTWITELGTCELWYRLLNLGIPLIPTGGSDTFPNLFRHMIIGCARTYVHLDGEFTWDGYMAALRKNRCFTTTGPLLDFQVENQGPGGVIVEADGTVEWRLDLYSPTPVDHVEIIVNGRVVETKTGPSQPGAAVYSGTIAPPPAGWIAARVSGGGEGWPIMDTGAFAHTAPIWIGSIGSREAAAAREAAEDLLRVLESARERVLEGYAGSPIPNLKSEFDEARERLRELIRR